MENARFGNGVHRYGNEAHSQDAPSGVKRTKFSYNKILNT